MLETCTFEWSIKNFSHCSLKTGEEIETPPFDVNTFPSTKWSLLLYSDGVATKDYMGIRLKRENDNFKHIITLGFDISLLDVNGLLLMRKGKAQSGFDNGSISRIENFVARDKIFGTKRNTILPRDILLIQCSLWMKYPMPVTIKSDISVSTILQIICDSFSWKISRFNELLIGLSHHFVIKNENRDDLMSFSLVKGTNGDIKLEIMSWDEKLKSLFFKISFIDSEGHKVDFGFHKYFVCDFKKIDEPLIRKEELMENKNRFLPNDVLFLVCEYSLSTGNILHVCKDKDFEIIPRSLINNHYQSENEPVGAQNVEQSRSNQIQSLAADLKTMYSDAVLSDVELRTSTKTFPCHQNILSARSSVFQRMFSNDMKEKNSGHVDITDLEDDTLHSMLLYVYTDSLEDIQFDSASKLYSAADKYAIISLKEKCSCFLKENISPATACDLLVLADRYQDDDLKCAAQDYILSHNNEIFQSQEWTDFMSSNVQLAADVMHKKLCQN